MKTILTAIIFFISLIANAQNDRIDPGGALSLFIMQNMFERIYRIDEANFKANKIKEVTITDEEGIIEEKTLHDREGRVTEHYYGENAEYFKNQTQKTAYTKDGDILQVKVETQGRTVTLDVTYGENYPEYLIIKSEGLKSLRYDVEMNSGKIKKLVNENFENFPLMYLFNYTKDYASLHIKGGEIKELEVMSIKFSETTIICTALDMKIIYQLENNRIKKYEYYKEGELVSEVNYSTDENGNPMELVSSNGVQKKRKYSFVYYED